MSVAERRLRLGIIGCGRVVERYHLPALARVAQVDLVGLCDPDPGARSAVLNSLAGSSGFRGCAETPVLSSIEALLGGPPLDAVLIATPPSTHAALAVRTLEAGLHVLVEKPMALDVAQGARMAAAARGAGRRLQVGFNRRFRDPYGRLHHALAETDGRQIRAIHFELAFPTAGWGARSSFLGLDAEGGGVIDDVLSHQVDLLGWVLRASPERVRVRPCAHGPGVARRPRRQTPSETVRAWAEVELAFADGFEASCRAAHGPFVERLEVELASGRVLIASASALSVARGPSTAWRRGSALARDRVALLAARVARRPNATLSSFERQLRDFADAVAGKASEGAGPEDGMRALAIAAACRESERAGGRWIALA